MATASPTTRMTDLCSPEVERIETGLAWVFLCGSDAWKIWKPIRLEHIDCTTPEKRGRACQQEIERNQPLAPAMYRGVVPVHRGEGGGFCIGGAGKVVDWAIHMHRLMDSDRADRRLSEDRLSGVQLIALAEQILRFHESTAVLSADKPYASPEELTSGIELRFARSRDRAADYLQLDHLEEVQASQLAFLKEHASTFRERRKQGFIRNVHGDLRLEHIFISDSGEVAIIDRLESKEWHRWTDTAADISALSVDLNWRGRADLAEIFLSIYADRSGDFDLYKLVDFYEVYRAYLLGEIQASLAEELPAGTSSRNYAEEEARRYFLLALAEKRRPLLPPIVVVMSGLVASGKSTVARAIAFDVSAPIILSDHVRHKLLGTSPDEELNVESWERAFAPSFPEEVYTEVFRHAGNVLDSGRPVVVDGCFGNRRHRAKIQDIARRHGVPFLFVECQCTSEVAHERLSGRAATAAVSEEEWMAIYDGFRERWEPVEELPSEEHIIIDTGRPLEENVTLLRQRFPTWPPGYTG